VSYAATDILFKEAVMANISEEVEEAAERAKEGLKENVDRAADAAEEAADRWSQWSDDVADYCRERPFMAIGIAAAVGALLGAGLAKALTPSETSAERRMKRAVRVGEETWRHVKSGVMQAAEGLKGIVDAFKD
jgi:ElaB/YqjD/DUF883 family membrane-anchored ribosome-binding protein